jgi:hypothetical protein
MTRSHVRLISAALGILVCAGLGAAAFAADAAPQEWRGAWVLERDLGAAAVSALSGAQVKALLGTSLLLTDRTSIPGGATCTSPQFRISQESPEAIASDFRVQLSELRAAGPLSVLDVGCESDGYSLVRRDAQSGLLIYQGHVFLAVRGSGG